VDVKKKNKLSNDLMKNVQSVKLSLIDYIIWAFVHCDSAAHGNRTNENNKNKKCNIKERKKELKSTTACTLLHENEKYKNKKEGFRGEEKAAQQQHQQQI
jgi:hypothetical protein